MKSSALVPTALRLVVAVGEQARLVGRGDRGAGYFASLNPMPLSAFTFSRA